MSADNYITYIHTPKLCFSPYQHKQTAYMIIEIDIEIQRFRKFKIQLPYLQNYDMMVNSLI